jgi:hypothetical protein
MRRNVHWAVEREHVSLPLRRRLISVASRKESANAAACKSLVKGRNDGCAQRLRALGDGRKTQGDDRGADEVFVMD